MVNKFVALIYLLNPDYKSDMDVRDHVVYLESQFIHLSAKGSTLEKSLNMDIVLSPLSNPQEPFQIIAFINALNVGQCMPQIIGNRSIITNI